MPKKCFVIQPFDGGRYDKRYDDVFRPAIEDAGFDAYRVDQDPAVEVPIEEIEQQIQDAEICLAEITENNANVWYELGFAVAAGKSVVMICSNDRERFPFDVQHRKITRYSCESPSDFKKLRETITERLKHVSQRNEVTKKLKIESTTKPRAGLADHEIAALITIGSEVNGTSDGLSVYRIKELMEKAGFTGLAGNLAVQKLISLGFIKIDTEQGWNSHEEFEVCVPTLTGWDWIHENLDAIELRKGPKGNLDDEIPF
ncbi:hypothetical protein DEM25_012840 [Oceaniradius stylonematis]|uniref:Nucleoside 2-deoxyribosyltransferase n=1 Tax=Oceaniradius stylonematis TaxID=2184161 RepID=A0A3A8A975_9HYPH|nr:hypothetical protein [Oceaniradius stylonematis]RKF06475.1 hypothetical protein DEM25_012840 [Oceaniradius stylonematis]